MNIRQQAELLRLGQLMDDVGMVQHSIALSYGIPPEIPEAVRSKILVRLGQRG